MKKRHTCIQLSVLSFKIKSQPVFQIHTNGLKTEDEVSGVYKGKDIIHTWKVKIEDKNTFFMAELLYAIKSVLLKWYENSNTTDNAAVRQPSRLKRN